MAHKALIGMKTFHKAEDTNDTVSHDSDAIYVRQYRIGAIKYYIVHKTHCLKLARI
jgi:hypothetical protein